MPTYQYACTACGHRFEAVQSFTDDALTDCPACAGQLRKLFSSVGIVFKGSGFYRTDSRSGNGSASGSGDGSKAESKSTEKSTTAPAAESTKQTDSGSSATTSASAGSNASVPSKAA